MTKDKKERALEFLYSFGERSEAYHAHKENMAYGAATLYIAGLIGLLLSPVYSDKTTLPWEIEIGISATALFIIMYVWWQFRLKDAGGSQADAATSLAAHWLANDPTEEEIRPFRQPNEVGRHGKTLPLALAQRMWDFRFTSYPVRSEDYIHIFIAGWTLVALCSDLHRGILGVLVVFVAYLTSSITMPRRPRIQRPTFS